MNAKNVSVDKTVQDIKKQCPTCSPYAYTVANSSFISGEHWFHVRSYTGSAFSFNPVLKPPGSTIATLQPRDFNARLHTTL